MTARALTITHETASGLFEQAGIARGNTKYHHIINDALLGLWLHHPGTAYHTLVGVEMAGAAGEVLDQSRSEISMPFVPVPDPLLLRFAFAVHDIKKTNVNEAILAKEGPLDAAEHKIIRTHPSAGFMELYDRGLRINRDHERLIMYFTLGHHIVPVVVNPHLLNQQGSCIEYDFERDDFKVQLLGRNPFHMASYPHVVYYETPVDKYEIIIPAAHRAGVDLYWKQESLNWAGNVGRFIDSFTAMVEGRPYVPPVSLNTVLSTFAAEIDAGLFGQDRRLMMRILYAMSDQVIKSAIIPIRDDILHARDWHGDRSRSVAAG